MNLDKEFFDVVIYHKGCLDGFTGFFVGHMSGKYSRNIDIIPDVPSANSIPSGIDNKNIIIIDVAYKREIIEGIVNYAKSVVLIDHHLTTLDEVKNIKSKKFTFVYDELKSGATLTWKYFYGRQTIPLFLKYIEDQDIGKWEYENTKPFIFALKTYYNINNSKENINKWFKLLDKDKVSKLIKKGKHMQAYNNYIVDINLPKHTVEKFPSQKVFNLDTNHKVFAKIGQYKVGVYCGHNCPSVTEIGTSALERYNFDFCIMWVFNLDSKKYVLSMRSKIVDVSEICKLFGGGGHKLAAACSFYSNTMRIEDLFDGHSLPRSNV